MKHEINDNEWHLLTKYIQGECDDSERQNFEKWLEGSDQNGKANRGLYEKVKNDLSALENIKEIPHDNPAKVWSEIESHIDVNEDKKVIHWHRPNIFKYAAAIIMIISASVLFFKYSGVLSDSAEITAYAHSKNEKDTFVNLSDGSKVWLSENSTLGYSDFDSQDKRLTSLEGEAYFEIARNEQKPFIIQIGETSVKVLGTAFNIKYQDPQDKTVISVTHGKVSFFDQKGQSIFLTKGEEGVYNPADQSIVKQPITDMNFLSWKTGIIRFEDLELSKVCKTLSKHYNIDVIMEPNLNANLSLNAMFDNQELEDVLAIIAETLDLKVKESEKGFILQNNK